MTAPPSVQADRRSELSATSPTARPSVSPRPKFRPTRRKWTGPILAAVLAVAGGAGLIYRATLPKVVSVSAVERGTAVEAVYATGTIEAVDRVSVKAKVSGVVAELLVSEGAGVRKGQLLARIDVPSLKFELQRGKTDLWAASKQHGEGPQLAALASQAKMTEAQLKTARDDRDRLTKLVESGTATVVELNRTTQQIASLEAQLAAQIEQRRALEIDLGARASRESASVELLSAKLRDTEVISPLDGIVLAKSVELGEVVSTNQTLLRIGDVSELVLECLVDEADIARIVIGQDVAVSLYAFPGRGFVGKVREIFPDAERTKKVFLTKVSLIDPPPGLRSGMSAEVNVILDRHPQALLAATEAVDDHGRTWVVEGGRVHRVQVRTGIRDLLRVEVLDGLREGQQVVVSGQDQLAEGARVRAELRPTEPAAAAKRPKATF